MSTKRALFITVGTGFGDQKSIDSLAHMILFSIKDENPDYVVFYGSKSSKHTIESFKNQYKNEFNTDFQNYEFVELIEINDFNSCFKKMEEKLLSYNNEYDIRIDYTSGTKTMTMTAAILSTVYRKELLLVDGDRGKDNLVISGTERRKSQSLYKVYDNVNLKYIKKSFSDCRFKSAEILLKKMVILENEDYYENLIKCYENFDLFNHTEALNLFPKHYSEIFPEISNQMKLNEKALNIINLKEKVVDGKTKPEHKFRCYYILADLLNNAFRRAYEGKYDDAIARLYRSLELIGQIKLKKGYKIITSKLDFDELRKKKIKDKNYLFNLEQNNKNKIGLRENFNLLYQLDNPIGIEFKDIEKGVNDKLSLRNDSILAHGLKHKTLDDYLEFKNVVMKFAEILYDDIYDLIEETKFPTFEDYI